MNFDHNQQNIQNSFKFLYHGIINQPISNQNFNKDPTQQTSSNKIGHWSLRENAKYYAFLKKYKHRFSQRQSRRQCKVFKALAEFMKTRNANQCRSHHHKMQKNFQTIEQNLSQLLKKNPSLDEKCQKYFLKLDKIESIIFGQEGQEKNQKDQDQEPFKELQNNYHQMGQQAKDVKANSYALIKTAESYQNQHGGECSQNIEKNIGINVGNPLLRGGSIRQGEEQERYVNTLMKKKSQVDELIKFSKMNLNQNYCQKVIQCNEYFIKWWEKINKIMEKEQQLKRLYRQRYYNLSWHYFYQ